MYYNICTFTHAQRNTQIFPSLMLCNRTWKLSTHMQVLSTHICLLSNLSVFFYSWISADSCSLFVTLYICVSRTTNKYLSAGVDRKRRSFYKKTDFFSELFGDSEYFFYLCNIFHAEDVFSGIGKRQSFVKELPPREIHICKKAFITRFVLWRIESVGNF